MSATTPSLRTRVASPCPTSHIATCQSVGRSRSTPSRVPPVRPTTSTSTAAAAPAPTTRRRRRANAARRAPAVTMDKQSEAECAAGPRHGTQRQAREERGYRRDPARWQPRESDKRVPKPRCNRRAQGTRRGRLRSPPAPLARREHSPRHRRLAVTVAAESAPAGSTVARRAAPQ